MIKLLLTLTALLLSSCAGLIPNPVRDPVFSSYVTSYESTFGTKYKGSIQFGENRDSILGVCNSRGLNSPFNRILINKSYWDVMTELSKEQLLIHELSHCVHGLGHDDTLWQSDYGLIPVSLMHSTAFADFYFTMYRSSYIMDIVNKINSKGIQAKPNQISSEVIHECH